jgi:hypothetical protein
LCGQLRTGFEQRDEIVEQGGNLQRIEQNRLDEHGRRHRGRKSRIGFDLVLNVVRDGLRGRLALRLGRRPVRVEYERQLHRRPS